MERGLYVITDETLAPGCSHIHIAKESLSGGAKMIQLRINTETGENSSPLQGDQVFMHAA